jgi:hypothetical protein
MNIPEPEFSNPDVPGRMYGSSKNIKFTKRGQVMSKFIPLNLNFLGEEHK